jgi:chitodextrinase
MPRATPTLNDEQRFYVFASANGRKAITYTNQRFGDISLWKDGGNRLALADDQVVCTGTTWPFRFFGGPGVAGGLGTAEYSEVCVSSNGFLTFDRNPIASPTPPTTMPSPSAPNAVIAPFWTDLDPSNVQPGGGVFVNVDRTYFTFTVRWQGVWDKVASAYQTFEVNFYPESRASGCCRNRIQDRIDFLYKSVTMHSGVQIGIEDQEGQSGLAVPFAGNGATMSFTWGTLSAELRQIAIFVDKADPNAQVVWDQAVTVGDHVETSTTAPTPEPHLFESAGKSLAVLLGSPNNALATRLAGRIVSLPCNLPHIDMVCFAIETMEDVHDYVLSLSQVTPMAFTDSTFATTTASATASAFHDSSGCVPSPEGCWGWPVDVSLGVKARWQLSDDPKSTNVHTVTIRVRLTYAAVTPNGQYTIKTVEAQLPLTLAPDAGDTSATARSIAAPFDETGYLGSYTISGGTWTDYDDYYRFSVPIANRIQVSMSPRDTINNFQVNLYRGTTLVQSSPGGGFPQRIDYAVDSPSKVGDYYVQVHDNSGRGLYRLSISTARLELTVSANGDPTNTAPGVKVYFSATPSGGTAPYSFTWTFGDGTTAIGNRTTHVYGDGGSYAATVTVTDSSNPRQTASENVITSVSYPPAGVTSISPTSQTVYYNEVCFVPEAFFAGFGPNGRSGYTFNWNFGDGAFGAGQMVSHVYYGVAGTYTVTLSATDSGGRTTTATATVTVRVTRFC